MLLLQSEICTLIHQLMPDESSSGAYGTYIEYDSLILLLAHSDQSSGTAGISSGKVVNGNKD